MLKVSHETVAAGEEQLVSCAAEQSKYCSIYTVTLEPCGVTSWGRWQCRRGGRTKSSPTPSTLSVGWESIAYIKRRKKAEAYKTRTGMPRAGARAGATGDAGGAAGGKERSTEAQTNNCEWPANGPASRRLLISESRLLIPAAFIRIKTPPPPPPVSQRAQFYVQQVKSS